jgi:hypothetical protein
MDGERGSDLTDVRITSTLTLYSVIDGYRGLPLEETRLSWRHGSDGARTYGRWR